MEKPEKKYTDTGGDVDKRVKLVNDRKWASKEMKSDRETAWNKAYQYYLSKSSDEEDRYFVPETYAITETILTRMVDPFKNLTKSPVDVKGRRPEDKDFADHAEGIAHYGAVRAKLFSDRNKLEMAYRQNLIYGFTVGKVFWRTEKETRKVQQPLIIPDPIMGMPIPIGMEEVDQDYYTFDDTDVEVVNVYDFFPDPAALDMEEMRWCIESKIYSREELEAASDREGGFFTPSLVKKMLDEHEEGDAIEDDAKQTDMDLTPARTLNANDSVEGKFKVDIMWTKERIVACCDERWLLTDRVNDYGEIPFVVVDCMPIPFQLYGIGIPELLFDQQDSLNKINNLIVRNAEVNVNRMYFGRAEMFDQKDLKTRPGGIVWVKGGQQMRLDDILAPVPFPELNQTSFMVRDYNEKKMADASAVTEYSRGQSMDTAPKQTATEVMSKTEQGNIRFKYLFNHFGEFVTGIYKMILRFYQKFMNEPKTIQVLGKRGAMEYRQIAPEYIQGEFDMTFTLDPVRANDQQRAQQTMQFLAMATQNPELARRINWGAALHEVGSQMEIDQDIIKPEEQVQLEQQQQLQAAQIQAAMQQQGMPGLPSGPNMGMAGGQPPGPGMAGNGGPGVMPPGPM